MFDFIKFMFIIGSYKDDDVAYFVKIGNINTDDYKQITNEDYKEGAA